MRGGAWVGRAPAGPGNGRHVEVGGCRRLEHRGVPLLCRRQPLFRAGARRRAAASVAGAGAAQRLSPAPPRPPARPPALRPCPSAGAGALAGEHLLPLVARLLPFPVTRRALARPPHRARSARPLAAAAARPAPPRLPPLLTRTPRRRRSWTDGAATARAVAAPPLRRARRARAAPSMWCAVRARAAHTAASPPPSPPRRAAAAAPAPAAPAVAFGGRLATAKMQAPPLATVGSSLSMLTVRCEGVG